VACSSTPTLPIEDIEAKIKGREAKLESVEAPLEANVVDLMERLRRSLGQVPASRRAAAADRARRSERPKPAKATKKTRARNRTAA
jgi:non-homologous end joining protein Ku